MRALERAELKPLVADHKVFWVMAATMAVIFGFHVRLELSGIQRDSLCEL